MLAETARYFRDKYSVIVNFFMFWLFIQLIRVLFPIKEEAKERKRKANIKFRGNFSILLISDIEAHAPQRCPATQDHQQKGKETSKNKNCWKKRKGNFSSSFEKG